MARTEFWTYVDGRGRGIADEVLNADKKIERKFRLRTNYLGGQPVKLWPPIYVEKLNLGSVTFFAMRMETGNVQQRPIGTFIEGKFVILVWATEKNNRYQPREFKEMALRRLGEIESDSERMRKIGGAA